MIQMDKSKYLKTALVAENNLKLREEKARPFTNKLHNLADIRDATIKDIQTICDALKQIEYRYAFLFPLEYTIKHHIESIRDLQEMITKEEDIIGNKLHKDRYKETH